MTEMTKTEVQKMADEAYACFQAKARDNGDTFYTLKDGSPEWVTDLVREAHGHDADGSPLFLPDDWRYKWTMEALEWISDSDAPEEGSSEFADQAVSVYIGERIAWLGSNLNRLGYCDEASQELGGGNEGIGGRIGLGQYMEAEEVYWLALGFLNERIEQ